MQTIDTTITPGTAVIFAQPGCPETAGTYKGEENGLSLVEHVADGFFSGPRAHVARVHPANVRRAAD